MKPMAFAPLPSRRSALAFALVSAGSTTLPAQAQDTTKKVETQKITPPAAGETIAVIGVSGGVGGAVTQIAKARGARVIGIDRHEPHPDSPAARLVDEFVPFDDQTAARVRELTGGAGAEAVYDAVGGVAFELALSLAKRMASIRSRCNCAR